MTEQAILYLAEEIRNLASTMIALSVAVGILALLLMFVGYKMHLYEKWMIFAGKQIDIIGKFMKSTLAFMKGEKQEDGRGDQELPKGNWN